MAVPGGPPPTGPTGGYPAPVGRVRFDVIGEAWSIMQPELGSWVVAGLLWLIVAMIAYFVIAFVGGILFSAGAHTVARTGGGLGAFIGASIAANIFTSALLYAVLFVLICGVFRMAVKRMRGEPVGTGDLFSITDVIGGVVVGGILYGIAATVGWLALCVGYLVVGGLLMSMPLMVVERRLGGVEAVSASFNALKSDPLMAILFFFLFQLIIWVSAIPCGLGMLFTVPLYCLAVTLLYRDFFPEAFPAYPGPGAPSVGATAYPYATSPAPQPPAGGYPEPAPTSAPVPAPPAAAAGPVPPSTEAPAASAEPPAEPPKSG